MSEADVVGFIAEQDAIEVRRRWASALLGVGIGVLMMACAAAFILLNAEAEPQWMIAPTPASTTNTVVGREPLRCADGWYSPSIGRQGACSHHGGVVGGELIYETAVIPARDGVLAPERTDWGVVFTRALWILPLSGAIGALLWNHMRPRPQAARYRRGP